MVVLPGWNHVAAETYYDNQWHYLDLDAAVFRRDNGRLASLDERALILPYGTTRDLCSFPTTRSIQREPSTKRRPWSRTMAFNRQDTRWTSGCAANALPGGGVRRVDDGTIWPSTTTNRGSGD